MATLARRFLFLPLAHGICVTHNHLVHPGERLREEHCTLEEAQVASMQRQGEDHVRLLCWRTTQHAVIKLQCTVYWQHTHLMQAGRNYCMPVRDSEGVFDDSCGDSQSESLCQSISHYRCSLCNEKQKKMVLRNTNKPKDINGFESRDRSFSCDAAVCLLCCQ